MWLTEASPGPRARLCTPTWPLQTWVPRVPTAFPRGSPCLWGLGCLGATCSQRPLGMNGALSLPWSGGEARAASCLPELPVGPGGDQTLESRTPRASPSLPRPHSQAASPKRRPPSTAHSPVTARCRAAPGYLSEHRSLKSVGMLGTDFRVREPSLRDHH